MGGIALILSGAILTSMLQLYFAGQYSGEGIVQSRWWWEIAMNLQVLCLACMWFCYVDRVSDSEGPKKTVMRVRMLSSLTIVLLPFWVALLSAWLDWFGERPPLSTIELLMFVMISVWGLAVFIPRFLVLRSRPDAYGGKGIWAVLKPEHWYAPLPSYAIVILWIVGPLQGSTAQYEYGPLLFYLQGAMPYLQKGLGFKSSVPTISQEETETRLP